MKSRKWLIITIILVAGMIWGCGEDRDLSEPREVLNSWSHAIERLDYSGYSRIESSPRSERSFRKMYSDYYITGIRITRVDPEDGVEQGRDHNGTGIEYRYVHFIADAVKRNTGKPMQSLRGQVKMIRYPEGSRSKKGWMLSNRTLVRIKQ